MLSGHAKWSLQWLEKALKSLCVLMLAGKDLHSEASAKLKAFWPREVLVQGRLSWEEEDERVL